MHRGGTRFSEDGYPVERYPYSAASRVHFSAIHSTRYGKYVLDKIVEEKYTVVYCHYGLTSTNKPSFSWLRQVYGEMDRK